MILTQSVKQCMAVDLSPLILANVADIRKEHILLHTPVLNIAYTSVEQNIQVILCDNVCKTL